MLNSEKKLIKAKEYKCEKIRAKDMSGKECRDYFHLIKPVGKEIETVKIDPDQLVKDYIELISEYSQCPYLRRWTGHVSYEGVISKIEQNRIANVNRHISSEQERMEKALMEFINKYGLFGIMNDRVAVYDHEQLQKDGSRHVMMYPTKVIVPNHEGTSFSSVEYDEYIKVFFPEVEADEVNQLTDDKRICQYSEYMEDILQNKRILACTDYIASINKQCREKLTITGLDADLFFVNGCPSYEIRYHSLIQYCHSMFFLNEIGGENKKVRICQYRHCRKPFIGSKRKYCCDNCMRNANKSTKKRIKAEKKEIPELPKTTAEKMKGEEA